MSVAGIHPQKHISVQVIPSTTRGMDQYVREYLRRLRLLVWNETEQRPCAFLGIYLFLLIYTIGFVSLPVLLPPTGPELVRAAELRVGLVLWTTGL